MTIGLKPYPAYKASGVEWPGKVPEHWEVRRIRTLAQIINGATPSSNVPEYWDGDLLWLTPSDLGALQSRYVQTSIRRITQRGYESCGTSHAPVGSVAVSIRAPIGHIGILNETASVNQGCRLLSPNESIASEYLYFGLWIARAELNSLGRGSTFMELSGEILGDFRLSLPPFPEQTAIARFLDHATANANRAIANSRRQIKLLKEYRTRLIADVVTGKLDVREAAAKLPEGDLIANKNMHGVERVTTHSNL